MKSRYEFFFHEEFKRKGKIDDKSIITKVMVAQKRAAGINKEIDAMVYEHDRESHLMRYFLSTTSAAIPRGSPPLPLQQEQHA